MSGRKGREDAFRALVCINTCNRVDYLRRYLPAFAQLCGEDRRFDLLVALDGDDPATREFARRWEVPLVYSVERQGVGISKNRALLACPDHDYYFFLEDDAELLDGGVFAEQIGVAERAGIHHFSLFRPRALREQTGVTEIEGHEIRHALYGGADFNFFTAEALRTVGGWHPGFARYRRWGHTEHSYRVWRAGLAPAPFNLVAGLDEAFVWHAPPSVTVHSDVPYDEHQIAAPERELMDQELTFVPVEVTGPPTETNGVPAGAAMPIARQMNHRNRYPLLSRAERRRCRSDFHADRAYTTESVIGATARLCMAWALWPRNPANRATARSILRRL